MIMSRVVQMTPEAMNRDQHPLARRQEGSSHAPLHSTSDAVMQGAQWPQTAAELWTGCLSAAAARHCGWPRTGCVLQGKEACIWWSYPCSDGFEAVTYAH